MFMQLHRLSLHFNTLACALAALICLTLAAGLFLENLSQARYAERVADQVLRLHVIANSDSEADQELKLRVRDALLAYMAQYGDSFQSAEEAAAFAEEHCEELAAIAAAVVADAGFPYGATASVGPCEFPDKTYDTFTFPAGTYNALRIRLGSAQGHNWWCVLYPPLCLTQEGTATVPDSSQARLEDLLSPEDYARLQEPKRPQLRFLLWDWLTGRK